MKNLTYNEIIETNGEEIGLAYENLVCSIISGMDTRIEIMVLADACENLLIAQELINRARVHAQQEIDEAASNDAKLVDEFLAVETKTCTRCKETKVRADFPTLKRNKDGLDRWCKSCCDAHRKLRVQASRTVVAKTRIFPLFR